MTRPRTGLDPRGPRFGQALTGSLTLAAFLLDQPLLVAGLALVLGAGALLGPRSNLWAQLYKRLVQPRLSPPASLEHPAPPRFAQALGALFLASAALLLLPLASGLAAAIGWALVLIVSGLALLAALTGLCLGCELYVRLQRWQDPRPDGVGG